MPETQRALSTVEGPVLAVVPTIAEAAAPAVAAPSGMAALRLVALGEGTAVLAWGAGQRDARVDPTVHPAVLKGALERGERVVAQDEGGVLVVVGVLRTCPTPGIDEAEEFVVRADRVRVEAGQEFRVVSGAASFALRAYGYVETIAEQITSRAASVHKIVGRMLHLN